MSCNCKEHNHSKKTACNTHGHSCEEKHEEHICECNHHEEHSCGCHHHKENQKLLIIRLVSGAVIFAGAIFFKVTPLFLFAYLILGYDVLINAVKDLRNIFNESFLMSIASLGAFAIGEPAEATAVMLFYQLGEFLSHRAAGKSRKSITALMDLRADTALVLRDGEFITSPCEDIRAGEIIRVSAGEKIPLDGVITKGSAFIDTSALTGEAIPYAVKVNDNVLSGSINTDSVIEIKVTKEFAQSTASKILELVSSKNSGQSEKFITKFAKIYTPIVVILALCIAVIPSLITGEAQKWIYTALTFLMVSCPCALVVSVPLTFVAGIGGAAKKGILVKGAYAIEKLSKIQLAAFDKTGTLTEGKFKLREISAENKEELLTLAAHTEFYSSHPIAKAIASAYIGEISTDDISDYKETAGKGVSAVIFGNTVRIGTADFAGSTQYVKNAVFVSVNGEYKGYIVVEDSLKFTSKAAITRLKEMNIDTIMLTGDTESNAAEIANELGILYHASLLPQDKIERLENSNKISAFIGDGINDAPVISRADIGISMGGIGSDAAIEASDAVIMADDPQKVADAVKSAKHTMEILWENIIFAIGIKILIMILGIFGLVSMWAAVFVDVGVCLLAVLNAIRACKD